MSRLGTSRNVQWSAEGVTNSLCFRAHNHVNLSSLLRRGCFDERTKKMKEIFLRKMKCIFGRKTKASYLMTVTLLVQGPKSSLYLCCSSRKRTVSVSFISFEKYELRMKKKIFEYFFVLFCPKTPSMKKN